MGEQDHKAVSLPRRQVTRIAPPADMDVVKSEFLARWAGALRRRLRPRSTLEVKQFAAAIDVRYETALRWLRATSGPSGDAVAAAVAFFDGRGDTRFRDELFPGPVGTPTTADAEREQQRAVSRFLEDLGVAQIRRCLWFADEAKAHEVVSHTEFARAELGLNDVAID